MTIDLFKLEPLVVQTPMRGKVALRLLSCASLERLQRLRSDVPGEGEFLRRALHAHLVTPSVSFEEFEQWAVDDVHVLARAWAAWRSALQRELPTNDLERAFGAAFDEYSAKSMKGLRAAFADVSAGMKAREADLRALGLDHSIVASFRAIEAERRTLAAKFDVDRVGGAVWNTLGPATLGAVYQSTQILSAVEVMQRADLSAGAALQDLTSMTAGVRAAALYESALSARLARLEPPALVSLAAGLESLSGAAGRLFGEWARTPEIPRIESLWLREAPALELYSASRSALSLVEQATEAAPEAANRIEVVAGTVEPLLAAYHPELVEVYHGAIAALNRTGPDYRRHFAISCRELLTHVLHRLAPTEAVISWQGARPEDFEKGKPTRRGRARYILRRTLSTAYEEFVEHDAAQVSQLIAFLQGPAHGIGTSEDRGSLRLVLMRVEAFVALLLEADRLPDA